MNEIEYLLAVVAEESAEVAQRAMKAIRFGLREIQPGQLDDNKRRLERELADLMETADQLGLVIRDEDKAVKRVKLAKYMEYSRSVGTLEKAKPKPAPFVPSNSCNRHDDCAKANALWKETHAGEEPPFNIHCHDECCEDCFGS